MMYLANHKYRRARLTQTLAANYAANLGYRQAGDLLSESVVEFLPNAAHTNRIELRVERPDRSAFRIFSGKWIVLVNLDEAELQTGLPDKLITATPSSVMVRRIGD
jgi:hypothetical protein